MAARSHPLSRRLDRVFRISVTLKGIDGTLEVIGGAVYAGIYLLSHGLAKVAVVIAVLQDRLWAYPAMIVLLAAFIVYQLYRLTVGFTIGVALLTIFDVFVVWLTWREYQAKRSPAPRS